MYKKVIISFIAFIAIALLLVGCKVIWTSPPYYKPASYTLKSPILTNEEYGKFVEHRRPFIFYIKIPNKGAVYILGLEHSKDPENKQLDSIKYWWNEAKPTVAFVEGRLGFLFSWFQNPVKVYGEAGFTAHLAYKSGIKLYTWEPSKDDQIETMVSQYEAKKVALFYSLRPYFSNFRYGKPANPEKQMNEYISSRTDHPQLKGLLKDWQEIDAIWKKDFAQEKDWRDYSDEWGYPVGYLTEMASFSNLLRDIHLCNIIIDLVQKGETVFVTVGSSHAVKIQKALEATLKN